MIMHRISSRVCINKTLFGRLFSDTKSDNEIDIFKNDILNLTTDTEKKDYKKPKHWNLFRSTPENFNQSSSNIFLFPGQGTQFAGMGKNLTQLPEVQRLFESASEYLKYDLQKICLEGPPEKLRQTIHSQPAIFVTSLAALEKVKQEQPELIENCIATAGQSLGEITSLVFAGALSFEEALHFISVRAKVMEEACQKQKGGLLVVPITPRSQLSQAMLTAKQYCYEKLRIERPVCEISTYLYTECRVIGGHLEALEFIETFAREFHLRGLKRLDVSGAFHTSLMTDAYQPCVDALKTIRVCAPRINTLSNASGTVHTSATEVRRLLAAQVHKPVLWEQILHRLYMRPPTSNQPSTIGVGPGRTMGPMVKRVNALAFGKYIDIDV